MKLPKTIFVKQEKDGDSEYLIADEDLSCVVDNDGTGTTVGTYQLVKTENYRTTVELIKAKPAKK